MKTSAQPPAKSPAMTSVIWVRNIIEALDACGLDGQALAQQAGIKPELLGLIESGVLVKEIIRLWELAAQASNNPSIGLLAAQAFRASALSVLGYSMMSSPNLQEALHRAVRYSGAVSSATTVSLDTSSEGSRLTFHIMTGIITIQQQNHEYIILSMLNFFRWFAGQDLTPIRVEFMHPKPADLSIYRKVFNCPLNFDCKQVALVFSERDMQRPLMTSNKQLSALHDIAAEQAIEQLGRAETTQRIRQLIVEALPKGEPTRDEIASRFNISARTLQRRLQDEGQNFHEVLDDVRQNLALQYLANEKTSLTAIASLLGFSDQSSFTRATRRWFGNSPSKVRGELSAQRKAN
jgi:AraC-like DNA-binding protein